MCGTKAQHTRSHLLSNHSSNLPPFITHPFNSLSNLLRRYSRPLTISPDDSLIDPITISFPRHSWPPCNPLLRRCTLPRWSPLVLSGRRVSFIRAHISTLISRMVIHRSHQLGLVSARSSSSSASPFCSIPLSPARARARVRFLSSFFLFFRGERQLLSSFEANNF